MEIHLLPEHIIDQIKAGEVIDSPAGIIKELIENSIDAGATQVDLHLVNNGLDLISLKDNGKGIGYTDLPLAFARHATSKIEKFDDLYRCHSFGFRGEALASLASVAKVTCQSSTINEKGQKIVLEGGHQVLHEKLSAEKPQGTEVFIKELFFNTPARFKFMNSQAGEKSRIKKTINHYLISHPEVSFSLRWDDQDKVIYPASSIESRFLKVTKTDEHELFQVSNQYEDLYLNGYIGKKEKPRPIQYCYVNKRPIEDDRIRNTINHTLLNYGLSRKQDWILDLHTPQNKIDVNVHPKKTKVKFFQPALVYSLISNALKHFFKDKKSEFQNSQSGFTINPPSSMGMNDLNQQFNNEKNTAHTTQENFIGSKINFSYTHSPLSFIKNKEFLLIEYDKEIFGSSFERLSTKLIEHLSESNSEVTPLLVATPLSLTEFKPETLKVLGHLNIEVSAIETNYWVIKSLPSLLASFPSSLLNQLVTEINNNSNLENALYTVLQDLDQSSTEALYKNGFFNPVDLEKIL